MWAREDITTLHYCMLTDTDMQRQRSCTCPQVQLFGSSRSSPTCTWRASEHLWVITQSSGGVGLSNYVRAPSEEVTFFACRTSCMFSAHCPSTCFVTRPAASIWHIIIKYTCMRNYTDNRRGYFISVRKILPSSEKVSSLPKPTMRMQYRNQDESEPFITNYILTTHFVVLHVPNLDMSAVKSKEGTCECTLCAISLQCNSRYSESCMTPEFGKSGAEYESWFTHKSNSYNDRETADNGQDYDWRSHSFRMWKNNMFLWRVKYNARIFPLQSINEQWNISEAMHRNIHGASYGTDFPLSWAGQLEGRLDFPRISQLKGNWVP